MQGPARERLVDAPGPTVGGEVDHQMRHVTKPDQRHLLPGGRVFFFFLVGLAGPKIDLKGADFFWGGGGDDLRFLLLFFCEVGRT